MTEKYGVEANKHIPGAIVGQYLEDYARHFGIMDNIQFHTKVNTIEETNGNWTLTVETPDEKFSEYQILTEKLVMATGLTNEPFIPTYEGEEKFNSIRQSI